MKTLIAESKTMGKETGGNFLNIAVSVRYKTIG